MRTLIISLMLVCTATALTCYEGTLEGLGNNSRTEEKGCSLMSNYCVQKIDRRRNQIRRECSSFTDEHNMEEKCPMSGCHWQSVHETYCCCQFDNCNEWKSDGTEYRAGETVPIGSVSRYEVPTAPSFTRDIPRKPVVTEPSRTRLYPEFRTTARTDEIRLD